VEIFEHLKLKVEELSPMTDHEWKDFSGRWMLTNYSKNEFVTKTGQVEKYFYFVHSGVLRGFVLNNGSDISMGFSYDGDFSGVYDSLLNQSKADWNLQALVKTDVLKITYSDLMEMFDKYKSIERWGRIFNANALIGLGRRQLEIRNYSAEERFDRLATQSPHIFQLVPQKYLASYLGMTPETFSRMRRQRMS